jgi:hypothetical protein
VTPLLFRWEGDSFVPIRRHAKDCDARFTIGEHYALEEVKERSSKSHAQYFAAVNDAWLNLPDGIAEKFPTAEHLRKHALIASGYFDKRSIQAASKAEALRLAAFIRPMDEYAIVTVSAALVEVYTAKSQSYKAMGKAEFQASKQAVLDYVASMIGVSTDELKEAAA